MGIEYETKLQFLDLSMADISKDGLLELFSRCRQLRKISLEHVALDSEICEQISENINVEALNLTMCEGIEAQSFDVLCGQLPR